MTGSWLEQAERIEEPGIDKRLKTSPFLGRVPRIFFIALGISEVDRPMGHVEVTTKNNRFFPLEILKK